MNLFDLADVLHGQLLPCVDKNEKYPVTRIETRLECLRGGEAYLVLTRDPCRARRETVAARLQGAVAVINSVSPYKNNIACILVDDIPSDDDLDALAKLWRAEISAPVICVTGSAGKTTTKELLHTILSRKAPCAVSPGSRNGDTAAALNLFLVSRDDRFAVLEAGINHTGEMERISAILRPDIGIVTNISAAHLERLGSVENVLTEKLKLFEHATPGFTAFLNGDDPLLRAVTDIRGVKPRFFHAADWHGKLPFAGEHFRTDVAAAAAVASYLGVSETDIAAAVEEFTPPEARCQFVHVGNCTVINDCYNANPASMQAALELLSTCPGKRIAVLGDMLELGENAPEYHRQIGALAAETNIDALVCIGELAEHIALGALDAGYPKENCARYPSVDAFLAEKHPFSAGSTVLLKASHAMGFERILRRLQT